MVKHLRLAKIHENRESFPLVCFDVYGIIYSYKMYTTKVIQGKQGLR